MDFHKLQDKSFRPGKYFDFARDIRRTKMQHSAKHFLIEVK